MQNGLLSLLLSRKYRVKAYVSVVVPDVLYECDTWYVTLWEERRLRETENRDAEEVIWA
jgi:hypothetical protein